jgi:PAS domain-containing protein
MSAEPPTLRSTAFPCILEGNLADVWVEQVEGQPPRLLAQRRHDDSGDPRQLIHELEEGVVLISAQGSRYVDANATAARLFGHPLKQLLTRTTHDLTPAEHAQEITVMREQFRHQDSLAGRLVVKAADGSLRTLFYQSWPNVVPGYHLSLLYPR